MRSLWFAALVGWPAVAHADPSPSLSRSKTRSRNLVCERVSAQEGKQRYPGKVFTRGTRVDHTLGTVMVCRQRLMRLGLRGARDEVVLSELEATTGDLALAATASRPDLAESTWLVEAYYPDPQVEEKIDFATKNALMSQGLSVSDRAPRLAVGDVEVLTRMTPTEAYPAACARYAATGSLGDDDVLLAVLTRDLRETGLHGGLCVQGQWQWLK